MDQEGFPAPLPKRLVAFLAAERRLAFCQRCLAQSLEATQADARASLKLALRTRSGIAIRHATCARCRALGAVAMIKTAEQPVVHRPG